jgi:hypothetical protein
MSQLKIKQIEGLQTTLDAIFARLESGSLKSSYDQVGHGFTPGKAITFLDGSWVLADASSADKLGRLIVESVTANSFVAVQIGHVEVSNWGLTPGKYYVVNENGDGTLAEYESTSIPNFTYSNPIIQAITSEIAQVLPWRPSLGAVPTAIGQEYTQSAFSLLATTDGASTGITLDYTPFEDSTVQVYINGIALTEGYGTTDQEVYFSNDGGVTAKDVASLEAGDTLYWNTNIAGYAIGPNDTIDIVYEKSSLD